jgi:hypothetical protein
LSYKNIDESMLSYRGAVNFLFNDYQS